MGSDQETSLFLSLILSLEMAAMQQMGKLLNPLTGKIERDLNQARSTIDLLNALKARTQGNLSPEEEGVFNQVLTQLQLNFVEESGKGEEPLAKEPATISETEAATPAKDSPPTPEAPKKKEKKAGTKK
jgi:hypothetical protein